MKILLASFVVLLSSLAFARGGLIIHSAEMGISKFQRYDNKVHPYTDNNVWKNYILADNPPAKSPIIQNNKDGSVTIFFSSLHELLVTATRISTQRSQPIQVLNISAHGMPGGMWFPKDEVERKSEDCKEWRETVLASDKASYDYYYSPSTKEEIMDLRATGQTPAHYACVVGLPEWREVTSKIPNLKSFFAQNAQVHILSCLVGYGPVGDVYTRDVASLLLGGDAALLKSSIKYGLGDWSMPEGMGFWDYIDDAQLAHDNEVYPVNRQDREIMQKGAIRVAHKQNGQWNTSVVADQDFMLIGEFYPGFSNVGRVFPNYHKPMLDIMPPTSVRIPGTGARARLAR